MLAIILEMIAQAVKARNEAERQARIEYARNNPADYLRRFGRVREINANDTKPITLSTTMTSNTNMARTLTSRDSPARFKANSFTLCWSDPT